MTKARYQSLIDAWRIATAALLLALLDQAWEERREST